VATISVASGVAASNIPAKTSICGERGAAYRGVYVAFVAAGGAWLPSYLA